MPVLWKPPSSAASRVGVSTPWSLAFITGPQRVGANTHAYQEARRFFPRSSSVFFFGSVYGLPVESRWPSKPDSSYVFMPLFQRVVGLLLLPISTPRRLRAFEFFHGGLSVLNPRFTPP